MSAGVRTRVGDVLARQIQLGFPSETVSPGFLRVQEIPSSPFPLAYGNGSSAIPLRNDPISGTVQ